MAVAPGEASVTMHIPTATHVHEGSPTRPVLNVLVLEPGTFRVSGAVTSTALPEAASIEIVSPSGGGARMASRTWDGGRYGFYGVAGDVQLRVSADGFESQTRQLRVTDNVSSDFDLRPLSVPAEMSGAWTLTLSASDGCRAALPEVAWQRQFDATISQQGTHFEITLASPTWNFNRPTTSKGKVFGQTMSFGFAGDSCDGDRSYPDLFDALNPTEWLGIMGSVTGTVAGPEVRATLDSTNCGALDVWETGTNGRPGLIRAVCHAKDSPMVLRRK